MTTTGLTLRNIERVAGRTLRWTFHHRASGRLLVARSTTRGLVVDVQALGPVGLTPSESLRGVLADRIGEELARARLPGLLAAADVDSRWAA